MYYNNKSQIEPNMNPTIDNFDLIKSLVPFGESDNLFLHLQEARFMYGYMIAKLPITEFEKEEL